MPIASSFFRATSAARDRAAGVRIGAGALPVSPVSAAENRSIASWEVSHRPPSRMACSLTREPSRASTPSLIHRHIVAMLSFLPERDDGTSLHPSCRLMTFSVKIDSCIATPWCEFALQVCSLGLVFRSDPTTKKRRRDYIRMRSASEQNRNGVSVRSLRQSMDRLLSYADQ